MRFDRHFLRISGYWFGGVALALLYPFFAWASDEVREGILAAAGLSLFYHFFGFIIIEWSWAKSNLAFLKYVLAGITFRLVIMAISVLVFVKIIGIQPLSLLISLMLFYVLNLMLEIHFLQKKATQKGQVKPT